MRIDYFLVLASTVILYAIGLSFQFECLPNGAPIPYVPRSGTSPYSEPSHRARSRSPPAEAIPRVRSRSPHAERFLHASSRSHSDRHILLRILGQKLEEARFVRLIPNTKSNMRFEIRAYTFPREEPIKIRGKQQHLEPMPTGERMVLSTSGGDVFAILERNNTILRGIYIKRYYSGLWTERRVKINMDSGAIKDMNQEEIQMAPLGMNHPISKHFRKVIVDEFFAQN